MTLLLKIGRVIFNRKIKQWIKLDWRYNHQVFMTTEFGPTPLAGEDLILLVLFLFFGFHQDYVVFMHFWYIFEGLIAFLEFWMNSFNFWNLEKWVSSYKFQTKIFSYFVNNIEQYAEHRVIDYSYRYIMVIGFSCGAPWAVYSATGYLNFVNWFGAGEMEIGRGKTALGYYIMRLIHSPLIYCYSEYGDFFKKPIKDWQDLELYTMLLLEMPGIDYIDLFRDYRSLHHIENFEQHNIYYKPFQFVMIPAMGIVFFFGCLFNGIFFFSSFAFALAIVVFIINEFSYELDESFSSLSSLAEYRKLFYKQIVFLPKVVEEWAGHSFFTQKLEREVQHFCAFYEDRVASGKGFSHADRVKALHDDPLVAVHKLDPKHRGSPEGFSLMPEVVKYDDWVMSRPYAQWEQRLRKIKFFNFSDDVLHQFVNKLAPILPDWNERYLRSHILFFAYQYRYASSNDPAVVYREFMSLDFRNSFMQEIVVPSITQDQHEVMQKMFTPEGFIRQTPVSEFEKFFGK